MRTGGFKYLAIFLLLSLPLLVHCQSTAISVTATDPSGQAWANGTISYSFKNNNAYFGPYQWQGANLPSNYLIPTVVALDGNGSASFSLPDNTTITPAGSSWNITVCPDASTTCAVMAIPVSGTSQNISSVVNANLFNIVIPATDLPKAYSDTEIKTVTNKGGMYYNVVTPCPKYWNGTGWTCLGTGGGSTPATQYRIGAYILSPSGGNANIGPLNVFTDSSFSALYGLSATELSGTNCALYNYTCNSQSALFNTATNTQGNGGQSGINQTISGIGSGKSVGPAVPADPGWSVTVGVSSQSNLFSRRGIKQLRGTSILDSAVGDTALEYAYMDYIMGTTANSDEGVCGYCLQMIEFNSYYGNIDSANTSQLTPTLDFVGGTNLTCDGCILFDRTLGVLTMNFAGTTTAYLGGTGSIPITGATLPVSSSIAICNGTGTGGSVAPQVTRAFYVSENLVCTLQTIGGTTHAITTGVVTVGSTYPEQDTVTAVSAPSGTTQNITVLMSNPQAGNFILFQGGLQGYYGTIDTDVTASTGQQAVFYVFGAIDTSHLIYGIPRAGVIVADLPRTGGDTTQTTTSAIHLFHGAEVVQNTTTGANPQLEVHSFSYAPNDIVQTGHPFEGAVEGGLNLAININSVGDPNQPSRGIFLNFYGGGIGGSFEPINIANSTGLSTYSSNGIKPPSMLVAQGYFSDYFDLANSPCSAGVGAPQFKDCSIIHVNSGTNVYSIWSLNGTINPSNSFLTYTPSATFQTGYYALQGIWNAQGLSTGSSSQFSVDGNGVMNAGTTTLRGHLLFIPSTVTPIASACGGGSAATSTNNDNVFIVSGITAATACTVTFNTPLRQGVCTVNTSSSTVNASVSSSSTTAVTFAMSAALTGSLNAICF